MIIQKRTECNIQARYNKMKKIVNQSEMRMEITLKNSKNMKEEKPQLLQTMTQDLLLGQANTI